MTSMGNTPRPVSTDTDDSPFYGPVDAIELKAICPIDILRKPKDVHHDMDASQPSKSVSSLTPPSLMTQRDEEADSESTMTLSADDDDLSGSSYTGQTLVGAGLKDELALMTDLYYPTDPDLPWHFCYVDDGMIAGMSAPVEKRHWQALKRENVGLVVNLTESLITPALMDACRQCGFMNEYVDDDVFHEAPEDIDVLFLPVQDGNIPRWEQLKVFLKHARETVQQGKKVAVHCQAGVGRTGVFLCIYIMEKYRCSAAEAIARLRVVRPQSLQFHRIDWQTQPFYHHPGDEYVRNYFQERFIERYYLQHVYEGELTEQRKQAGVPLDVSTDLRLYIDTEIDHRLSVFANQSTVAYHDVTETSCAACSHVLCLGPFSAAKSLSFHPQPAMDTGSDDMTSATEMASDAANDDTASLMSTEVMV